MKLLIKFPTRQRPEKFLSTVEKYHSMARDNDTRFLVSIDKDDSTMNNPSMLNILSKHRHTTVCVGISENKIHACNRDINDYKDRWDILLLASDDMIPVFNGYDRTIISQMQKYFPDTDGVLFFSDGHTPLNTLCIIGRKYYDRFGYVYHPGYKSLWCDNEFMDVADILGKQIYFKKPIIIHEHYSNGFGQPDELMKKTESYYLKDKDTYFKRKSRNFNLQTP